MFYNPLIHLSSDISGNLTLTTMLPWYLAVSVACTIGSFISLWMEYIYHKSNPSFPILRRIDFLTVIVMAWIPGLDLLVALFVSGVVIELLPHCWKLVKAWLNKPIS